MGGVKKGGSGCICPESVLLSALVTHMVLLRDEVVVMDMEAGIEHLGRATAQGVDRLIVVVEPGRRSIETAHARAGAGRGHRADQGGGGGEQDPGARGRGLPQEKHPGPAHFGVSPL